MVDAQPRPIVDDSDGDLGVGPAEPRRVAAQRKGRADRSFSKVMVVCSNILCCSTRQYENMEGPSRTPGALSASLDDDVEADFRPPENASSVPWEALAGQENSSEAANATNKEGTTQNLSSADTAIEADEQEDIESYRPGGYHRVQVGDTFHNGRYRVINKLGWGHFSTVWRAIDTKESADGDDVLCAVKIQKSAEHYREAAYDEIKLLQKCGEKGAAAIASHKNEGNTPKGGLLGWGDGSRPRVVKLSDWFEHNGPNGKHVCMVFEILGDSMLQIMRSEAALWNSNNPGQLLESSTQGLPIPTVKLVAKQVLEGLHFLHQHCGIIHTDLKPENILFRSKAGSATLQQTIDLSTIQIDVAEDENGGDGGGGGDDEAPQCCIIDFGNACWVDHHFADEIQTRQYRCPEVILGATYGVSSDIWSFACVIFELITGDLLFDPREGDNWNQDEDHLAQIMELLGPIPRQVFTRGKSWKRFLDFEGELQNIADLNPWSMEQVLTQKYEMPVGDAKGIASFLTGMLAYDTTERATALQALEHPWLDKDAADDATATAEFPELQTQADKLLEMMEVKK